MQKRVKNTSTISSVSRKHRLRRAGALVPAAAGAVAVAALLFPGNTRASTDTWVGTSSLFNAGAGAAFNNAPATGDVLIFGTAGSGGTTLTDNLFTPGTFNCAGFNFSSGASTYIINAGSGSNGINFNTSAGILNSSTVTQTINDNLTIVPTTTTVNVSGGSLALGGTISGTGGFYTIGAHTVTLTGTNTFTGYLNIAGNSTVSTAIIGNSGAASPIGENVDILFVTSAGAGTLVYTGSGETNNRVLDFDSGYGTTPTITDSGTGLLNFTANIANNNGGASKSFQLNGSNTGVGQISGLITNGTGGSYTLGLIKSGTGQWNISNTANTFTGITQIGGGIFNVASLANDGTASSLGSYPAASETGATIGILFTASGTLQYTGSTPQSTNRMIRITNGATAAIDASGTGAGTLSFTATTEANLFAAAGTRTLELTGTNTGLNTFAAAITDQAASTGQTSLIKAGAGQWVLPGASTYTGTTNVSAGTLMLTGSLANTAVTVHNGATLTGSGNGSSTGAIGGAVSVVGGGAINFAQDGLTGGGTTTTLSLGSTLALGDTTSTPAGLTFNINSAGTDEIKSTGALTVNSSGATVNINNIGTIATGLSSYTLMTYPSQSGAGAFTLGSVPAGVYSFNLSDGATSLVLNVSANATPITAYWTGNVSTVWTGVSGGTSTNFSSNAAGTTDAGQLVGSVTDVVFNSTPLNSTAVSTTLGANQTINSLTFNSTASVGISGSNTLTIAAGASNSGSGSLGYSAGTGIIVSPGAGPVTINASTLIAGASQSWTNNSPSPLNIASNVSGSATAGNVTTVILAGSGTGATVLSGNLSDGTSGGQLGLNAANLGSGYVQLSGINTFSGGVNLSSGNLNINSASALGTGGFNIGSGTTIDNASAGPLTLATNIPVGIAGSFTFKGTNALNLGTANVSLGATSTITTTASNLTIAGNILDGGAGNAIIKAGPGTLTLGGTGSTYSGGVNVSSGLVNVTGLAGLGTGPVIDNATLNLSAGAVTYTGLSSSLSGGGTVNVSLGTGSNSTLLNGNYSAFTGTWNIGIGNVGGKVQMNGLDNSAATINILTNASLFAAGVVTHNASLVLNGGTPGENYGQLRLDGGATWAGNITLAGNATGTVNAGLIGSNSGTNYITGNISGGSSYQLSKVGGGAIVLSGSNTYTGGTVVNNGTLDLIGNQNGATGSLQVGDAANTNASVLGLGLSTQTMSTSVAVSSIAVGGTGTGTNFDQLIISGASAALPTLVSNSGAFAADRDSGTTVNSFATWNQSGSLTVQAFGGYSSGVSLATGGTLNYTGTSAINLSGGTNSNGIAGLTISGGTLNTSQPINYPTPGGPGGAGRLILGNGGQLTLTASIPNLTTGSSTGQFQLGSGGGVLNLNNFNTSIGTGITGTGSLTLNGPGTLTLTGSNSYSGATNITSGTLVAGSAGALAPTSAFNVSGGTLDASQYANTVGSLTIGSTGTLNLGLGAVLTSTGAATLAGTLHLGGSVGGSFPQTLLTYASYSGTFTNVTGTAIPANDTLTYTSTALEIVSNGPSTLTWNNNGGSGDGVTWDINNNQNWNNGTGVTVYSDNSNTSTGDIVNFTDTNNGHYNVTLNAVVNPTATNFNATGNYNLSGTGGINGSGGLSVQGGGAVTVSTSNTYTGGTNVSGGKLILASAGAFPSGASNAGTGLTVAANATVQIANHASSATYEPFVSSVSNNGTIDITNNAVVLRGGGASIGTISNQITAAYNGGAWNGTSGSIGVITSSTAAADSTHLTAVGFATGLTTFEGGTVSANDLLIKYTYYGDANLDGHVDGSDYSRIDNGVLMSLTGWQNGDFNYDSVINGSDYTLIDNAFNQQGAQINAQIATPTAQIAGQGSVSAVPEPASVSLLGLGAVGLLGRRNRRRN